MSTTTNYEGREKRTTKNVTTRKVQITRPNWKGKASEKRLNRQYLVTIGERLQQERHKLGLMQSAVADALGVSKQAVSAVESGSQLLGADKMALWGPIVGIPKEEWGRFLVRYTNPHVYALIYGLRSQKLREELASIGDPAAALHDEEV